MPEVDFEKRGHLGVITLNRPQAVNALTAGIDRLGAVQGDDAEVAALFEFNLSH